IQRDLQLGHQVARPTRPLRLRQTVTLHFGDRLDRVRRTPHDFPQLLTIVVVIAVVHALVRRPIDLLRDLFQLVLGEHRLPPENSSVSVSVSVKDSPRTHDTHTAFNDSARYSHASSAGSARSAVPALQLQ